MILPEVPERFGKVVQMWNDEFEIGEEFDYCGIKMVRADTEHPAYYPKEIGEIGIINVQAIPAATEVEHTIHTIVDEFGKLESENE